MLLGLGPAKARNLFGWFFFEEKQIQTTRGETIPGISIYKAIQRGFLLPFITGREPTLYTEIEAPSLFFGGGGYVSLPFWMIWVGGG